MLAVRANGTERTPELTTDSALFIHGTPIDVLGDYQPANADGKHGYNDRRYTRDTDGPARPSTTARNEHRRQVLPGPAGRSDRLEGFCTGRTGSRG